MGLKLGAPPADPAGSTAVEQARAQAAEALLVPLAQRAAANGVGTLDSSGRQPIGQSPVSVETTAALATEPTVYVSKNGNDSNSGLAEGQAFLTVGQAITHLLALSGGTGLIEVGYGTFTENILTRPNGCLIRGCGVALTTIKLAAGQNGNVIQDAAWGNAAAIGQGGGVVGLTIDGNRSNQTGACPDTVVTSSTAISGAGTTLPVISTTGFAASGNIWVGYSLCAYTGKTGTSFTGVTVAAGVSNFTASLEMLVCPGAGTGHGLAIQSRQAVVDDVLATQCVGSPFAYQGAPGLAIYENRLTRSRGDESLRYGLEVLPNAPDGLCSNTVLSTCNKGSLFLGSQDWLFDNFHPTGAPGGHSSTAPQLLRICNGIQRFVNTTLDTPPYDAVRFDAVAYGLAITDIEISGQGENMSGASSAAGAGFTFYGNGSTSAVQRVNIVGNYSGRYSWLVTPRPTGYLVGVQNLAAPPGGQVQILNALGISPQSALGGVLAFTSGDNIAYTGTTSVGTVLTAPAGIGDNTLTLSNVTGFAASGIVTMASTGSGGTPALRIAYAGITGNQLTGVTGITAAQGTGTGVAQHFLTGVSGGTNASVADDTTFSQAGRVVTNISGKCESQTALIARNSVPYSSGFATLRYTGAINNILNPFLGTISVAAGQTTGTVSHGLGSTPTFYEATPTADPQQRWWATASSTTVTVTLASAAVTNPATFNVVARLTVR